MPNHLAIRCFLVALTACATFSGCSRERAAVHALTLRPVTSEIRRVTAQREGGDEPTPAEEIHERIEDISPYAPTQAGLTQLMRDIVAAAGRGDRTALEGLITHVIADDEHLGLALTYDGGHVLVPYLTGPAGTSRNDLVSRALGWGASTNVTVVGATGSEIATSAPAAAALDPGMHRIANLLRPIPRFYRVTLENPTTRATVVLETWVYSGTRWQYVPQPWRFALGSPDRDTVTPSEPWALGVPAR